MNGDFFAVPLSQGDVPCQGLAPAEAQLAIVGRCTLGIVHDLNNMLAVIQGQGELIAQTESLGIKASRMLRDLLAASRRARELSRSVTRYSKPLIGTPGPVDPARVIRDDLPLIRAAAPTVVDVRHQIAANCPAVKMDAVQLHRILMNLCLNAIDALAGRAGYVLVEAEAAEDGSGDFVLRVSDSGGGIDASVQHDIFKPFFSTRSNTCRTGVGLSNVSELVQSCAGSVSVESAPGCGATFTVRLPGVPGHVFEQPAAAVTEQTEAAPTHILYVDDEPTVTRIQRATLRSLGHRVACFTDPTAAEQHFRLYSDAIDLVITDACMPGLDGLELSRRIKAHRPHMPVILLTGSHEAAAEGAASLNIEEVLVKPVAPEELDDSIRKLLAAVATA